MRLPQRSARPHAKTIRPAEAYLSAGAEEARRLNHNYIGTEHILSVLARQPDSAATRLLAQLGVTAAAVERGLACWLEDTSPAARIDPQALATVGIDFDSVRERLEQTFGAGCARAHPLRLPRHLPATEAGARLRARPRRRTAVRRRARPPRDAQRARLRRRPRP